MRGIEWDARPRFGRGGYCSVSREIDGEVEKRKASNVVPSPLPPHYAMYLVSTSIPIPFSRLLFSSATTFHLLLAPISLFAHAFQFPIKKKKKKKNARYKCWKKKKRGEVILHERHTYQDQQPPRMWYGSVKRCEEKKTKKREKPSRSPSDPCFPCFFILRIPLTVKADLSKLPLFVFNSSASTRTSKKFLFKKRLPRCWERG